MGNRQMKQPTPLEKLQADKILLQEACRKQEQKLGESFSYLQENAGSIVLSGLSLLLFGGNKPSKGKTAGNTAKPAGQKAQNAATPSAALGMGDYLSLAKKLTPVLWEIVQPLVVRWGIRKAKKMLARWFSSKKKV